MKTAAQLAIVAAAFAMCSVVFVGVLVDVALDVVVLALLFSVIMIAAWVNK